MSTAGNGRTPLEVRGDLEREREELVTALAMLRGELRRATDVTARLREHLPLASGAALATGFVLAGGLRAAARLVRSRASG